MAKNVLRGFDAFLSEHRAKTENVERSIEIRGREYPLAPVFPASVVLRVQRLQKELGNDADLPPGEVLQLADTLFGKAGLEKIAEEQKLDIEELGELVKYVVNSYMSTTDIEVDGENPTKQNPDGISLRNGNTSNPISKESTVSA